MAKTSFRSKLRLCTALAGMICYSTAAIADPLIRDAEIEHTLRLFADPIFKVAGLNPNAIKIFVVESDTLNAYVAGGQNMFIYTGLITSTTSPDMLLGVMAHETGHIAGGHLAQGAEKLKNAQIGSILTYVLGAAAAVAARQPGAAAAVFTGGNSAINRNMLAYTRTHESQADQAALGFLDKLNISAEGMIKVFDLLQRNERLHMGTPDPYMLTHPLSAERITHVRNHVDKSSIPEGQYPKELDVPFQRMVAKLYGFLQSPEHTLQKYPLANKSVAARVARAVAYYKMPDVARSMTEMDSLIAESPKDPFFHELKGQILYENRRSKEALAEYETAIKLLPSQPLILSDLAKVELAQGDKAHITSAVAHLERSTTLDSTNSDAWHWLATAYGKAGNITMSNLALAEEALVEGDNKTTLQRANEALSGLKEGTPAYIRAKDLKLRAQDIKKEKEDENN